MLHLFSELSAHTMLFLGIALFFVLFYEAINGFHDTANAIATVIYTRALKEHYAVIMSSFANFFGVLLGGLSVAYAIVHLLPTDLILNVGSSYGLVMIFSILLAAIIWNLGTWYFGIPASSSHTLIGSIIGVALANAFITKTSIYEALNITQLIKIFLSLICSPIVGLVIAGTMIFLLRRFFSGSKKRERIHLTPEQREKIDGKKKPPFWIRTVLIISAAGVSFSHGANDGQKGIGLLMLVLISVAPASFMVNLNANEYEIKKTYDAINYIENYYKHNKVLLQKITKEQSAEYKAPKQTKLQKDSIMHHCNYVNITKTINIARDLFSKTYNYDQLSSEQKTIARLTLLCISDSITQLTKLPDIPKKDTRYLKKLRSDLLITVEYAPIWIIIAVALSLALGTLIGWRRVAVTIGEKIGKTSMTYAQGASAQITAALSIGVASYTGMPVSTTQVLSSAVAGTMIIDGGGVQKKTITSILLTWILTLPISIALSGTLFWLLIKLI